MIKYIGSKRRLVPVLGGLASAVDAHRTLDLFTGTTRVAQELKRRGAHVTAVDTARYAEVFAQCYVALDGATAPVFWDFVHTNEEGARLAATAMFANLRPKLEARLGGNSGGNSGGASS